MYVFIYDCFWKYLHRKTEVACKQDLTSFPNTTSSKRNFLVMACYSVFLSLDIPVKDFIFVTVCFTSWHNSHCECVYLHRLEFLRVKYGGDCIIRSYMICTPHPILCG